MSYGQRLKHQHMLKCTLFGVTKRVNMLSKISTFEEEVNNKII